MAHIVFYDATERDEQQLSAYLADTDHYWEFVRGPLTADTVKPNAQVISVFVSSNITPGLLAAMPNVQLIACRSTGYNNVPLSYTLQQNITTVNVPSYGEHTVAEYAFAMLLSLSRKLPQAAESATRGDTTHDNLTGFDLAGKTFGIIGSGRIGRRAANIAKGFAMNVIAYDPYPDQIKAAEIGFSYVSLEDLLAQSDVISLHAPYTPQNHHLINTKSLAGIKHGAVIINTARGELIDNTALIEALSSGILAGAALDVLEGETLLSKQEELLLVGQGRSAAEALEHSLEINVLKGMQQVILTSHNAFNTTEAIGRINQVTADNIKRFWYGETPNKVSIDAQPAASTGKLIVVRHAESEWNALGKWTGTTDIHLSERGFEEAGRLGELFDDIKFDFAYYSQQIRTKETLENLLDGAGQTTVNYVAEPAINERDYGDYTSKNKWEIRDTIGEEAFNELRRGWDYPVPDGETLKDVYERVLPFYLQTIVPRVLAGENILLVAHGNSIRSLIKYIENVSDQDIAQVEMLFGEALIYTVLPDGHQATKEIRRIDITPPNA